MFGTLKRAVLWTTIALATVVGLAVLLLAVVVYRPAVVRPLVEKCITIARRALPHQDAADKLASDAERHTEKWRAWRDSPQWLEWNQAIAPVVAARRRAVRLLGDKEAVQILFAELGPRRAHRRPPCRC